MNQIGTVTEEALTRQNMVSIAIPSKATLLVIIIITHPRLVDTVVTVLVS